MEDPFQVRIVEPKSVGCSIVGLVPTFSAGGEVTDKEGKLDKFTDKKGSIKSIKSS
jgi:hypothetical protein